MKWLKKIWGRTKNAIGCLFRVRAVESQNVMNGDCWVAMFDWLGFKNQISRFAEVHGAGNFDVFYSIDYADVVRVAQRVVRDAEKIGGRASKPSCFWFSDTFLFLSQEDTSSSLSSYRCIDYIIRHFFTGTLLQGSMFRGALSLGDMYANPQKGVFLGPAIIDAYEYVEKQDSLGVVLSPAAVKRLRGTELDPDRRADYAKYDVPVKRTEVVEDVIEIRRDVENLYAYRISKHPYLEKKIVEKQNEAKAQHPEDYEVKYKPKYEAVLKFIGDTRLST